MTDIPNMCAEFVILIWPPAAGEVQGYIKMTSQNVTQEDLWTCLHTSGILLFSLMFS